MSGPNAQNGWTRVPTRPRGLGQAAASRFNAPKGASGDLSKSLWVGDLKADFTKKHVEEAFKECGKRFTVFLVRDRTTGKLKMSQNRLTQQWAGYGFLNFDTHEDAAEVKEKYEKYYNLKWGGGRGSQAMTSGRRTPPPADPPADPTADDTRLSMPTDAPSNSRAGGFARAFGVASARKNVGFHGEPAPARAQHEPHSATQVSETADCPSEDSEGRLEQLSTSDTDLVLERTTSDILDDCKGIQNFAFFPTDRGYFAGCIAELAAKAMPENWSYKDENGTVRPYGLLENYVNMAFKYIVTHQREVLKFSADGSWVVFDTRLLSSFARGLEPIYALFQKNNRQGAQPFYFNGWCVGWMEVLRRAVDNENEYARMYGGTEPGQFSTEESTNDQPAWWKDFDSTLTVHADASHILSDNIERLRGIYTPSAAAPPQKKCWLFLGHSLDQQAIRSFFANDLVDLCVRGSGLAYAKFASPDVAAAVKKWCIKKKIMIGGTICKPVLSQGPPSEGEVEDIASDLTAALKCAKRFAKLNPRRVLPQLWLPGGLNSDKGFVRQLLLPLHLRKKQVADVALTIKLEPDRDNVDEDGELGWMYTASTVLTLDMAFNNARLVNSVESPWLCQSLRLHEMQQANDVLVARNEDLALAAQFSLSISQAEHHYDS